LRKYFLIQHKKYKCFKIHLKIISEEKKISLKILRYIFCYWCENILKKKKEKFLLSRKVFSSFDKLKIEPLSLWLF